MRRIIGILLLFVVGLEAIDFQCSYEIPESIYTSGPACVASNVNITSRQIITSVNGQTNFDGSKYDMVSINHQVVNFIPEGLGKFFPYIRILEIEGSKLKKVEKKDLQQFPTIMFLFTSDNEIRFLPNDLFEGNLNLAVISFHSNPISHIGHNLETTLERLSNAHFYSTNCLNKNYFHTTISSFFADSKEKCPEPTQEMIDCDTECEITFSPSIDFKCKMTEETCNVIDLVIELSDSKIGKVRDENGIEIESITKIRIVDQVMPTLPTNFAEKFPKVTEISIKRSGFFMFDFKTFSNLTLLTSLTLSNNKIINIKEYAFFHNEKLTKLNLAGNKLQIVQFDAFVGLNNLIELNLSHNRLIGFYYGAFSHFNQLAHIDVSSEFLFFMLFSQFI
jgi:Leucine-rich repeat (LRR) protein